MLDNVIALFKSICCNLNLQGAMAAGCGWDAWDGGVRVARNAGCVAAAAGLGIGSIGGG